MDRNLTSISVSEGTREIRITFNMATGECNLFFPNDLPFPIVMQIMGLAISKMAEIATGLPDYLFNAWIKRIGGNK